MTYSFDTLIANLEERDPDLPATFAAPMARTQGDWHVTRISLARLTHIDCDRSQSAGSEIVIELLDGHAGAPMTVGRLVQILVGARARLDGSGDAAVQVFYRSVRHEVARISSGEIGLRPIEATCRPILQPLCCT